MHYLLIDIIHLDKQLLNIKATFYWKYTSYEADEGDQDVLNERTLAPAPSVTVAPLLNLGGALPALKQGTIGRLGG